jgi:hypothetical protein
MVHALWLTLLTLPSLLQLLISRPWITEVRIVRLGAGAR